MSDIKQKRESSSRRRVNNKKFDHLHTGAALTDRDGFSPLGFGRKSPSRVSPFFFLIYLFLFPPLNTFLPGSSSTSFLFKLFTMARFGSRASGDSGSSDFYLHIKWLHNGDATLRAEYIKTHLCREQVKLKIKRQRERERKTNCDPFHFPPLSLSLSFSLSWHWDNVTINWMRISSFFLSFLKDDDTVRKVWFQRKQHLSGYSFCLVTQIENCFITSEWAFS